MSIFLLLAAEAVPLSAEQPILVTASRTPIVAEASGVSATIIDAERIEALGEVQAIDLLRTTPGLSVSVSGSRGTQAQVRIRGAEANHSLLFIDGIVFNDPASGNEPRFETLSADGLGRIEIVRGPQSALWGSEALGGVIALDSPDPLAGTRLSGLAEYGSRESLRGAFAGTFGDDRRGVTVTANHAESDGIDILGGGAGDRDGYENTTLGLLAIARPGSNGEFGIAARYIDAQSSFDGLDPIFFTRADTLDSADSETAAVRAWAGLGIEPALPWALRIEGQYLASDNNNFNTGAPLNRTEGERFRVSGQLEHRLRLGRSEHSLIAAIDREDEAFTARDQQFFGATDQDRTRGRTAWIGEWRAQWSDRLATDIAVRHDDFSRFEDATTVRASAVFRLSERLAVTGSYGEGIAQPTFFDLFGFFPGSFVGNPDLRPENARGFEIGAEWRGDRFALSATVFDSELEDEIVSVFDRTTFLSSTANATGTSDRRGIEIAATLQPLNGLRIDANYTFLDAKDQQVANGAQLREVRRPRHSANLVFDYRAGPLTLGGSVAYIGKRDDTDFDVFPAATVKLDEYFLASARIGYRVTENIELFGRVSNLFDEEYRDVVGFETPGIAAYAGLRLRLGN